MPQPVNVVSWQRDPAVTFRAISQSVIVDPRPFAEDAPGAQAAAAAYVAIAKQRQDDGKLAAFRFWFEWLVGPDPFLYNTNSSTGQNWWQVFGAFEQVTPTPELVAWWAAFNAAVNSAPGFTLDYAYHDFEKNGNFFNVPLAERQAYFTPVTIDDENNPWPFAEPNPFIGKNIWNTGTVINDQFLSAYGEFSHGNRANVLRSLTGSLDVSASRYSNYREMRLAWQAGDEFGRHDRLPFPSTTVGGVSSPAVYLDVTDRALFDPDPQYTTLTQQRNNRRWKRMLFKQNRTRAAVAWDGMNEVHPWIAPPGYGYISSDSWAPASRLPFENMLFRANIGHMLAMGIDWFILWNPSSQFNPNAAITDQFCDDFFYGLKTERPLDRSITRIDAEVNYDYSNIETLNTNGFVTHYADLFEITTLYYRRTETTITPHSEGFGTLDSPYVINGGAAGDAELAALLVAIGQNQGSTPSTQEVDVRSQTIGVSRRVGEVVGLTVSAEVPISGEFRVFVRRAGTGAVVNATSSLTVTASRSGSVSMATPLQVGEGDIVGVETISVDPDIRLRASVEFNASIPA